MTANDTEDDRVVALLERTLANRAAQLHSGASLAAQARDRRRRRVVRSSFTVAAAFGVAAAIAIPTAMLGSDDPAAPASQTQVDPDPPAGPYSGLPAVAPVPDGWRWETYGGIELQVPADWYTGATHQPWCAAGDSEVPHPYVDRPGPVLAIGCGDQPMDQWVPYVGLGAAGPAVAEDLGGGWTRETRAIGEAFVTVQADDRATLDQIFASARVLTDLDATGCPVDHVVTESLDARPTTGALDPAQVGPDGVVCQYAVQDGGAGGSGLTASYRLTPDQVASFVDALAAAPVGGGPDSPGADCAPDYRRGESALVVRLATTDGARDVIVWYSGCSNGADDGVTLRALTADLLEPLFHGAVFASTFNGSVSELIPTPST